MTRELQRWLLGGTWIVLAVLATGGMWLRHELAQTLNVEAQVQTAFLDLALRDRSRFLAETLQPARGTGPWPANLADVLTRNHADFNRDIFLQVFEPDGKPVAASANTPPGLLLSTRARQDGLRQLRWLTDEARDGSGRPLRLVTYPVYVGNPEDPQARVLGFAQAGLALPDSARALARFTNGLALTLGALGLGWVAALAWAMQVGARHSRRASDATQAAQLRFIGDAAHELGTPLAILRGELDLALRRERSPTEYRQTLTSCREEIEHLCRLSENLLALATADAGQALLHPADGDAATVARSVFHRFQPRATDQGVEFKLTSPDRLDWWGDALALEQILDNLVRNALQHTPRGERVEIVVRDETEGLVCEVRDTGKGIPPAHLPHVFDRFHRVDPARSRGGGGSGLGLAITRALVEGHGGTVSVVSELGRGSTFTCRFPRARRGN